MAKKRKPQDATMRNVAASKRRTTATDQRLIKLQFEMLKEVRACKQLIEEHSARIQQVIDDQGTMNELLHGHDKRLDALEQTVQEMGISLKRQ